MSLGETSLGGAPLGGEQGPVPSGDLPGVTYRYGDGIATITLSVSGNSNLDAYSLSDTTLHLSVIGDAEVLGPNGDGLHANIWVPQTPTGEPVWTPQPTIPGGLA